MTVSGNHPVAALYRQLPLRQLRGEPLIRREEIKELLIASATDRTPPLTPVGLIGHQAQSLAETLTLTQLRSAEGPQFGKLFGRLQQPSTQVIGMESIQSVIIALQIAVFIRLCAPDQARFERLTARLEWGEQVPTTLQERLELSPFTPNTKAPSRLLTQAYRLLQLTEWNLASNGQPVDEAHWPLVMALRSLKREESRPQWPAQSAHEQAQRRWWPLLHRRRRTWLLQPETAPAPLLTERITQACIQLIRDIGAAALITPGQEAELDTAWLTELNAEETATLICMFGLLQKAAFTRRHARRQTDGKKQPGRKDEITSLRWNELNCLSELARHPHSHALRREIAIVASDQLTALRIEEASVTRGIVRYPGQAELAAELQDIRNRINLTRTLNQQLRASEQNSITRSDP